MYNFLVIEATDDNWSKIINKSKSYDFYHTQSYHLLDKENRPILFFVDFKDCFIALPLVVRKIPGFPLFDCTSVYGYCGPVSDLFFEEIEIEKMIFFKNQLMIYFEKNNIITVFSRLHPLINTNKFFKNFGTVVDINKTVAIDLRITLEEQRKKYRKSIKYDINQLLKKKYEIVEYKSHEELNDFITIYYENMDKVNADKYYYFDKNYFIDFLNNDCFKSILLLAKKDGKVTAGAIFTFTNNIMQYHLACTSKEYIKDTPMKLILDSARLLGNDLKMDFLHLGGGAGGSDNDSLFLFKAGFSDYRCEFKIWKLIVDEKKYEDLIIKSGLTNDSNFFPIYRKNETLFND